MSTYTKYKIDARENLLRIRHPGDYASDGICEQRVIFSNPNNIYYGIFAGRVSSDSQTFNSCDINGGTINGTTLDNVTIKNGEEIIQLTTLTSNVSELSSNLLDFINNRFNPFSADVDTSISTLSDLLDALSNSLSDCIDENALSGLSSQLVSKIETDDKNLSDEIYGKLNSIDDSISSISGTLEYASGRLATLDNSTYELSVALSTHIDDNNAQFKEISSNIKKSAYYKIVGKNNELTSNYPYDVENFAVNIIDDHSRDIILTAYGENDSIVSVGSGYWLNDTDVQLTMYNLGNTSLSSVLTQYEFQRTFTKNTTYNINGCKVIWDGEKLTFNYAGNSRINVNYITDDNNKISVAYLQPYQIDDEANSLVSCKMNLQWMPTVDEYSKFFNPFIDKFGYTLKFNVDNDISACSDDGTMMIIMHPNSRTFEFGSDLRVSSCFDISSSIDSSIIGKIIDDKKNVIYGNDRKIDKINVEALQISSIQTDQSATLMRGLSTYIGNDLFMSFEENDNDEVSFNVVSSVQYYSYSILDANNTAKGYVIPELRNFNLSTLQFNKLSLHLDIGSLSSVFDSDYVLTGFYGGSIWQCVDDQTSNVLSIVMTRNLDNSFSLTLSGNASGIGDISYNAKYSVNPSNGQPVEELSAFDNIISSDFAPIEYSSKTYSGNIKFVKCDNPITADNINLECRNVKPNVDFKINVPEKISPYSREFIVQAKISSALSSIQLQLVDPSTNSNIAATCNGLSDINIPTNTWTSLKIQEVRPDVFVVDDLGNYSIIHEISSQQDDIDGIHRSIDDIYKNMRGGLNFMGVMSVDHDFDQLSDFLFNNLLSIYNDISQLDAKSIKIRQGFFYPINAENHLSHYIVGGLEIEHGDWLIAKNNFIVSAATSNDMTVFDAQDADNVRSTNDNTFTGNNTFTLSTKFEDYIEANCISTGSLSVDSDKLIYDSISSLKDLSNDAYSKIKQNANDIQSISTIVDTKTYLGSVQTTATINILSDWFDAIDKVEPNTILHKGAFARAGKTYNIVSGTGIYFIGENDYLIINKDNIAVSSIEWQDVDLIQDPKNEAIEISNDLSSLREHVYDTNAFLSNAIDNKIYIDSLSVESISAQHISQEDFYQKVNNNQLLSNTLYVVSSNYINAYGEQIKNLAEPELSDDATTKNYVDINDSFLSNTIDSMSADMLSSDSYLSSSIDKKIFIDGLSVETLSATHISQDDFYQKVATNSLLSNELYIVSSDYINAYSEQIKNVAEPTLSDDATTKNYVDINDKFLSDTIDSMSVDMLNADSYLSNAIDNKIYIDSLSVESISAQHIDQQEFYSLVSSDSLLSNTLYVVSSDYINAYGEQIKNLAAPTDLSDATTKEYVDDISSSLNSQIQKLSDDLSNEISSLDDKVIANDNHLSAAIDEKIFIDGLSVETLSATHISQDDFYQKVNNQLLSNELYIVSSDYINAYGEQLKNLASPTDLSDATTKEYVDINDKFLSDTIDSMSVDMLSTDLYISSSIDEKIFIDELSVESLCAIHISQDDFYQKVATNSLLSNELYIVSSDYINAYSEQIKNVAEPTLSDDATTKNYVDINDSFLSNTIDSMSVDMLNADSYLSASIDKKIFINGLSVETLSAIHISQDDFYQKVNNQLLSNELYIVSSNYINAYGEQIKNLAEPNLSDDAATKNYVDAADSSISGQLSGLISAMYDDLEHVATDSIISSLEQKSCISNVICAVVGIRDTLVELRQTLSTALGL